VFWTFEFAVLDPPNPNPSNIPQPVLIEETSTSGDCCHRNIHCLSGNRAKDLFYANTDSPEQHLTICAHGVAKRFDWGVLETLLTAC
jgi:hypothetical protein